jgi:hypothetical protein
VFFCLISAPAKRLPFDKLILISLNKKLLFSDSLNRIISSVNKNLPSSSFFINFSLFWRDCTILWTEVLFATFSVGSANLHENCTKIWKLTMVFVSFTSFRISVPGIETLNLSPDWPPENGLGYYGDGLKNGQCGVTIDRVPASANGQITCHLGIRGKEIKKSINLVVAGKF